MIVEYIDSSFLISSHIYIAFEVSQFGLNNSWTNPTSSVMKQHQLFFRIIRISQQNQFIIFMKEEMHRQHDLSSEEQGNNLKKKDSMNASPQLEWIIQKTILTIMEVPTKDQIFDFVSIKLGAFYRLFWDNTSDGLKKCTRKAGQIAHLAENMKQVSRETDRWIKVFAYVRDVKKFHAKQYEQWKKYIWADLDNKDKQTMEDYAENLTPPEIIKGQTKEAYYLREKPKMFIAYTKMSKAMLLVEVFEKIWTIRKYRSEGKQKDAQRHQALAKQIFNKMKQVQQKWRLYLADHLGKEEWEVIKDLV